VTRVLIDGQVFSIHSRGGIGRVFTSLFNEFNAKSNEAEFKSKLRLGILFSRYVDIPKTNAFMPPYVYKGFKFSKLFLIMNWFCLRFMRYEIVHSTYYFEKYLSRQPGTKHVVTIHDMIPEDFPHYFPDGNPHMAKEKFIADADLIVCVSNFTHQRLLHHYPSIEAEVCTVYPGVQLRNLRQSVNSPSNRILYVGKRSNYKGFKTLLSVMPILKDVDPSIKLLAVGGGGFDAEESNYIRLHDLQNIVSQEDLSDEELCFEYRNCIATVVTSEIEGFGLPLIEAMAQNALVVATDIPVFNEIGLNGFLKFPFGDSISLIKILRKIVENPAEFMKVRALGYEISQKYTWNKSARQMDEIYARLLK
jgi:glycosyltransferase involved in cell wall biosynthesis